MTKPETRQEMAEFIADKVLGWKYYYNEPPAGNSEGWFDTEGKFMAHAFKLADEIFSPDKFFAVWDALCAQHYKNPGIIKEVFWDKPISHNPLSTEKRYDAMYSAVWEAWNQ